MLVDEIFNLEVVGGKGGDGVVSWIRAKYIPKGGPGGGNGGKGGEVWFCASESELSLEKFASVKKIKAGDGKNGGKNKCSGAKGEDLIVNLPCGSIVKLVETGEVMADLTKPGQRSLICRGGCGGLGNSEFSTPTNRAPCVSSDGKHGDDKVISIELRCIADVGLIGLPNAGKTTLFSRITGVKAKMGAYPFTTLSPNLGMLRFFPFVDIVMADIPGLIDGASCGKGLGLKFLRHISRAVLLVVIVDCSGVEMSPSESFRVLFSQLSSYGDEVKNKSFILVLNKVDLKEDYRDIVTNLETEFECEVIPVSALSGFGLDIFLKNWKN